MSKAQEVTDDEDGYLDEEKEIRKRFKISVILNLLCCVI